MAKYNRSTDSRGTLKRRIGRSNEFTPSPRQQIQQTQDRYYEERLAR